MDLLFRRQEFHLVLNSNTYKHIYPLNKPYQFKINLPQTIHIGEGWKVALLDIVWSNKFASSETDILRMFIETNFVQPSIVNTNKRQLLTTVPILSTANRRMHYEPRFKHYVPISGPHLLQELEFYIKREDGSFITTFEKDLSIALHFTQ